MSDHDTPRAEAAPPHPLAVELADVLAGRAEPRVLLVGIGSGRNVPPLTAAGAHVDVVEENPALARAAVVRFAGDSRVRVARARFAGPFPFAGAFAGALGTTGFLHGAAPTVADAVTAVALRLEPGAPFFATFGSTRDPRFASGTRIDAATVVHEDGDEAGVPHVYFDETRLRALLVAFTDLDLREDSAAETAGRWAHTAASAAGMRHWFVRARRAAPQ